MKTKSAGAIVRIRAATESASHIPHALMHLVVHRNGRLVSNHSGVCNASGTLEFRGVHSGDGTLYLANNPNGWLAAPGQPLKRVVRTSPIDLDYHAFMGNESAIAQFAQSVRIPPDGTVEVELRLAPGAAVEFVPSYEPSVSLQGISVVPTYWKQNLIWGCAPESSDPRRPAWKGLLATIDRIDFQAFATFLGPTRNSVCSVAWWIRDVRIEAGTSVVVGVRPPLPDPTLSTLTGVVRVGDTIYEPRHRQTLEKNGYCVGYTRRVEPAYGLPSSMVIRLSNPEYSIFTCPDDTGRYHIGGIAPGRYLFSATYLYEKFDFGPADPLVGEFAGNPIEVEIRTPRRQKPGLIMDVRFPAPRSQRGGKVVYSARN